MAEFSGLERQIDLPVDKDTSVATARLCPSDEPWSFEY